MNTSFTKYSANGNHFILFDGMQKSLSLTPKLIEDLCHAQYGVGADGVALISPSKDFDFRFQLWNSDGGEAEMCGNAARAASWHFLTHYGNQKAVKFKTMNGIYCAEIENDRLWIEMSEKDESLKAPAELFTDYRNWSFLDTGVPHLVLEVQDVKKINLMEEAPPWRRHKIFPKGTNVDFISVADPKNPVVNLRVFERGVEGETWSCGTGVAAVGWSCRKFFGWDQTIKVITQGGEHQVKFVDDLLWYSGEIKLVFKGELP